MKASPSNPVIRLVSESEVSIDPDVAKLVGQEILENRLDPATWATALSACGGEHQEALAAYARIRIKQVSRNRRLRHSKVRSFEFRRVTQCFGIKTVQDLLQRTNQGKQLNFIKPKLSLISLITLGIGTAGCVGSFGRLMAGSLPALLAPALPLIAIMCGIAAIVAAISIRFILPKRWIMLGWNTGLHFACMATCFASLCFGAKLIAHAPPLEVRHVSILPSDAKPAPVLVKAKPRDPELTASNRAPR